MNRRVEEKKARKKGTPKRCGRIISVQRKQGAAPEAEEEDVAMVKVQWDDGSVSPKAVPFRNLNELAEQEEATEALETDEDREVEVPEEEGEDRGKKRAAPPTADVAAKQHEMGHLDGNVNKAPMSSSSTARFDAAPRKSNETTPEHSSKRKQATQPLKPKKPRVHQQAKFSKHCQGLDKANGTHDQCIFSTKSTGQPAIGNYDQKCVWCNPEATQQASALQHNNLVDTDEEFFNQIEADLLS